jgi:transposase
MPVAGVDSGAGETNGARLLAEIGEMTNYQSARQVAAYAGLTLRNNRSETIRGKTRLSKTGNARVRKALFLPAMTAKRYNPIDHRPGESELCFDAFKSVC